MKLQRFFALVLALCLVIGSLPLAARAAGGGSCGNYLRWQLDEEGNMRIYKIRPDRSGDMDDFQYGSYNDSPPWSIQSDLYQECLTLEIVNVVLEDGVTSIGNMAFQGCSNMKSISIPDGLTRIGQGAFVSCLSLTQIALPESLSTIDRRAFAGCTNLEEIVIPPAVTEIGDTAFQNCYKIETMILPPNITRIGYNTFNNCGKLSSLAIPAGVTAIADAFEGCSSLSVIYYGGTEEMWNAIDMDDNAALDLTDVSIIFNTPIYDEGWRMHAYTDNPNLAILKGQEMAVVCQLTQNFSASRDWDTPAWTIGSPDVISVKSGGRREDGSQCLTVTGLKAGTSSLTVTDTETGAFVTLNITVGSAEAVPFVGSILDVPHFYPNAWVNNHILTNFYDFNGLYVTDFPYAEDIVKTGGFYELSFTVYNERSMHGSVDVYDAEGNLYSCTRIEKDFGPDGVWDVAKGPIFLIRDTFTGDVWSFAADSVSQKTEVTIRVPEGGYFTISNNFAESVGTFIYNTVDYCLLALETLIDASIKTDEAKQIQNQIIDKILRDPRLYREFRDEFGEIVKKLSEYALYEGSEKLTSELAGMSFDFIQSLDIDFWGIVDSVCNITAKYGVSVLTDLIDGAGVAEVLEGLFALQKGADYLCQTVLICSSHDESYIHLYTPEGRQGASVHGVSVDANGTVPEDACLQVVRISNAERLKFATASGEAYAEKYELYNICFVRNAQEVQPSGKVTIYMPIPAGFLEADCTVLHQQKDGTWETVTARIEDGLLCFEVDHFSLFAVIDSSTVTQGDETVRLAGANRWETSLKVADEMKANLGVEKFDAIIVACGSNFADALAGSYLAAVKNAPILLSWGQGGKYAYLDENNLNYIRSNLKDGGTVYILGSEDAVPALYEEGLGNFQVKRLGGRTRFETNLMILEEAGVKEGEEILVCTSTNFADSLSASAAGKPILLVFNESGRLYGEQPAFLSGLKNCTFTIVGGESAVCADLAKAIEDYGKVERLAGSNRFETSVLVAEKYFASPRTAVLAYAWNFPDGLCGGSLTYSLKAPLILTMTKYEVKAIEYAKSSGIGAGLVLGDDTLISDDAVRAIFAMDAADEILVK